MTRDAIERAMRRLHTDELHNSRIHVYDPDISYEQGEGFDVTYPGYPDAPDTQIDARVDSPNTDEDTERSGTTSEVDVIVTVRDDTNQQWTGFGDKRDAPAHIMDTADGKRYAIREEIDTHNGLIEFSAVEV